MGRNVQPRKMRLNSSSPMERARTEIMALSDLRELQPNYMLGGSITAEMDEENNRRFAEWNRRKLEIIKKHGVADEYLKPLFITERRLKSELSRIQEEIAEIQNL